MKKTTLLLLVTVAAFSCKKETPTTPVTPDEKTTIINFDDATLDSTGVLCTSSYSSGDITLSNHYDTTYYYWEGFAISNNLDTTTADYTNQYSAITGSAHSNDKFAVAYAGYSTPTQISSDCDIHPKRLFLTNSTYVYKTILNGNAYSRAFAAGDYFTVTFTGINATGDTTGTTTAYLADFREGKSDIVRQWQEIDLTKLGTCRRITLSFNSTDIGDYGINTPCYAIIDDFEYYK